jgi:ribosome biogenesis protein Nip4
MIYVIKKTFTKGGKKSHVFLTNGHSEVLEITKEQEAKNLVEVLNENSDSGCHYEVLPVITKDESKS